MLREVVRRVHQLDVLRSSIFFLLDERVTLVDAGMRWSATGILNALHELGRSPSDIERVVITHSHYDHWGALASIVAQSGAEVCAHTTEAPLLRGDARAPVAAHRRRIARVLTLLVGRFVAPPVRDVRELEDGEALPVLGGLQAVHTPGHSSGHLAYYLSDLHLLFSGDAVQVNRAGRLIPPTVYEDRDESIRSLGRMAELDFDVLAPTHFPPQRDDVRAQLRELVRDG